MSYIQTCSFCFIFELFSLLTFWAVTVGKERMSQCSSAEMGENCNFNSAVGWTAVTCEENFRPFQQNEEDQLERRSNSNWIASSRKNGRLWFEKWSEKKEISLELRENKEFVLSGLKELCASCWLSSLPSNSLSVSITLLHPFPSRQSVIHSFYCQIILYR